MRIPRLGRLRAACRYAGECQWIISPTTHELRFLAHACFRFFFFTNYHFGERGTWSQGHGFDLLLLYEAAKDRDVVSISLLDLSLVRDEGKDGYQRACNKSFEISTYVFNNLPKDGSPATQSLHSIYFSLWVLPTDRYSTLITTISPYAYFPFQIVSPYLTFSYLPFFLLLASFDRRLGLRCSNSENQVCHREQVNSHSLAR